MNNFHRHLLATACLAVLGTAGMVSGANAATTCNGDTNCSLGTQPYAFGANDIYGAGSSLLAPYWRQISDCYGSPADLITKGTPPTFVDELFINFTKTGAQNCATTQINPSETTWYISTGSGSGILGVFSHDPVSFWGPVNEASGNQFFPEVFYGASDAGLGSTDVAAYNNGGAYTQGSTTINIAAPGAQSCANGEQGGIYPNPAQCYGPLIQFPLSIDPIAIFYANGGIYEKQTGAKVKEVDFHFNVQGGSKYGGLRLSANSLCGIFNGKITNWNDPSLTADNQGKSLADPNDPTFQQTGTFSVPLIPVARSDSSGTTAITTRHLANICQGYTGNVYTTGATTLQSAGAGSLIGQTYNVNNNNWPGVDTAGLITLAPNSSGVAQYVAFTQSSTGKGKQCSKGTVQLANYSDCIQQGRVGYVGADYVLPYVSISQTNSYNLFAAAPQNEKGDYVAPSPAAALLAFGGNTLPPQTASNGKYCATCTTNGLRNDPTAWVQSNDPFANSLANPTESGAYSIVGTTNYLGYSCYASQAALSNLTGQISYLETAKINTNKKGSLGEAGLSPLPKAWNKAINDAFVLNTDKLGLQISVAAKSGTTAACEAVANNGGGA
ncbi:MAG TPA: substrate-binding domain-containing protein [Rhizomicrobium sp.]|jgi:ABC-type phosphate transport system substrate-binding protein